MESEMITAHTQKLASGGSSSRIHCLLLGLFQIIRDPKTKIKKQLNRIDVPPVIAPTLPHWFSYINGGEDFSLICLTVWFGGNHPLNPLLHLTEGTQGWYMFAQRHSHPSASTHKSQSLWEGSHLWAEHSKCWTVSNNLHCRVISDWKWKRFLDPPNAERGRKSYNFMPATHVSYEGGNILSMTWMLCVVIKICLAKAVAQFEAHLRVCVILGLKQDLKPIYRVCIMRSLHVRGMKFTVNRK